MVIGGGHCSDTGATAFNGSYVRTVRSSAFGQEWTVVDFPIHRSIELPQGYRAFGFPGFAPGSVEGLLPHFQAAVEGLVLRLERHARVNMSEAFHEAAPQRGAAGAVLPVRGRAARAGAAGSRLSGRALSSDDLRPLRPHRGLRIAPGARLKFQRLWFAEFDRIVADRCAAGESESHRDLLDRLLAVRDPQTGQPHSDDEICEQCATMLLAGFETISRRLFWSSYLLALDTAEQIRKRQEVAVFDPAQVTTIDDLQHWPRLRQVMLEAKLLYPPETMVIRQALEPDTVCGESFVCVRLSHLDMGRSQIA